MCVFVCVCVCVCVLLCKRTPLTGSLWVKFCFNSSPSFMYNTIININSSSFY